MVVVLEEPVAKAERQPVLLPVDGVLCGIEPVSRRRIIRVFRSFGKAGYGIPVEH